MKLGTAEIFGYCDLQEIKPEEVCFDLAISIPQDFKLNDPVIERTLPSGRYAVTTHKGSHNNIGDTIYSFVACHNHPLASKSS